VKNHLSWYFAFVLKRGIIGRPTFKSNTFKSSLPWCWSHKLLMTLLSLTSHIFQQIAYGMDTRRVNDHAVCCHWPQAFPCHFMNMLVSSGISVTVTFCQSSRSILWRAAKFSVGTHNSLMPWTIFQFLLTKFVAFQFLGYIYAHRKVCSKACPQGDQSSPK